MATFGAFSAPTRSTSRITERTDQRSRARANSDGRSGEPVVPRWSLFVPLVVFASLVSPAAVHAHAPTAPRPPRRRPRTRRCDANHRNRPTRRTNATDGRAGALDLRWQCAGRRGLSAAAADSRRVCHPSSLAPSLLSSFLLPSFPPVRPARPSPSRVLRPSWSSSPTAPPPAHSLPRDRGCRSTSGPPNSTVLSAS